MRDKPGFNLLGDHRQSLSGGTAEPAIGATGAGVTVHLDEVAELEPPAPVAGVAQKIRPIGRLDRTETLTPTAGATPWRFLDGSHRPPPVRTGKAGLEHRSWRVGRREPSVLSWTGRKAHHSPGWRQSGPDPSGGNAERTAAQRGDPERPSRPSNCHAWWAWWYQRAKRGASWTAAMAAPTAPNTTRPAATTTMTTSFSFCDEPLRLPSHRRGRGCQRRWSRPSDRRSHSRYLGTQTGRGIDHDVRIVT